MSAPSAPWLAAERDELAATRILDAAGKLFAERGVAAVGMAQVAAAAGCSRATLYRYFESREALRVAFVHREARRIGADIARKVANTTDPARRLEKAVLAAIAAVRDEPALAIWFVGANAGEAAGLAAASDVIEALAASFLGDAGNAATRETARWVVRVVVSLLTVPGADAAEERRLVRRFLIPSVLATG